MNGSLRSGLAVFFLAAPLCATTVTNNFDSGAGSLRDAVAATPAAGTITFGLSLPAVIVLNSEIVLSRDVTISGPGASLLTISGHGTNRIFNVAPATAVAISGVTLRDGVFAPASPAPGQGGCIVSSGSLTVTSSVFAACQAIGANEAGTVPATAGQGGGIAVLAGSLTVGTSTFASCRAIGGNAASDATLGFAAGEGAGGGIWVAPTAGTVQIADTTFQQNLAVGGSAVVTGTDCALGGSGFGGGLAVVGGSVTLVRSTFDANGAGGGSASSEGGAEEAGSGIGGGLLRRDGALTVTNATFSNNRAIGGQQGLIIGPGAPATSTLPPSGSPIGSLTGGLLPGADKLIVCVPGAGSGAGGGLAFFGNANIGATLIHLSVAANTAADGSGTPPLLNIGGGGIAAFLGGLLTVSDTIVSGNTAATGPDLANLGGFPLSGGYNLISAPPTGGFLALGTDDVGNNTDPLLGSLANNGGPTRTLAIGFASPAKDAIPPLSCGATEDQRTVARPQGPGCDIGAFELQAQIDQIPTLSSAALALLAAILGLAGVSALRRRLG